MSTCEQKYRTSHWLSLALRRQLLAGICALLLPSFAVAAAGLKTVLTDDVLAHHAAVVHQLNCTITAPQSFRISSHATAELLQMLPVGSSVKKGQQVAKQDDAYIQRQINIIKTDIEAARVAKNFASEEFNRMNRLSKSGLTAATEINNLKFQLDSSELKIQRLEQELQLAQMKHKRLSHFAPFDAQVMSVSSEPGSQLVEGQPIMQLLSTQNKQLECLLPVISYSSNAELKRHQFILQGKPLALRAVGQQLDAKAAHLTLYFDHPALDRSNLLVGQIEQIDMQVQSDTITKVPNEAIELEGEVFRTWRVSANNKVERIPLKVLSTLDSHYVVESALRPGDKVVIRGQHGLQNGQEVNTELKPTNGRTPISYE
jgi:RND family efflux transporter MFP subunit